MNRSLVIVAALAAVLAGCGGETTTAPDNQATVLEISQHGAIKDVTQEQYHNQADLKAGWDKLYAGQSAPAMPTVDFTKDTIVMYAIGEHKTGGFKVRVLRSEATQGGYAMGFEVTIPGIGCHTTTQEMTRPFIVVSVPTTADISFDDAVQRRQPDCTAK